MATKKTQPKASAVVELPEVPTRESDGTLVEAFNADGQWTINGKPVERGPGIFFQNTDQALAMKRLQGDYKPKPRVTVQDDLERAVEQSDAAADNGREVWEVPDVLQEASDRVPRAGFRRRLLDEAVTKRRGMRGWKPVKDGNGDLVKVGDQFLGEMPISRAEVRNAHYQQQGESERAASHGNLRADMEKTIHDGAAVGIRPLQPGETITRGGDSPVIGGSRHRGNSHFPDTA